MEEEKVCEVKKIKVKRPFMKLLSKSFKPLGITLLIAGIAFFITISYDKNVIKEYDAEDEFHSHIIILTPSKKDMKKLENKFEKYDQDEFADYLFDYDMDRFHVIPVIISGIALIAISVVSENLYKQSQEEEIKQWEK